MRLPVIFFALILVMIGAARADDVDYIRRFHEKFPATAPAVSIDQYATRARYDALYMGSNLDSALKDLTNDRGQMAWDFSYRMMSLNQMFRNTGDVEYLRANLRCARAAIAARDDKLRLVTFDGRTLPAWGSGKYSKRGRCIFLVHTGMIVYPIADAILLAKQSNALPEDLRRQFLELLPDALTSLHLHDDQWRDGPGAGEGHYIGKAEEESMDGRPQPGNRLSALGRALWVAYKITGEQVYRDRCIEIGWYIKRRLSVGSDGAYYWAYRLPDEPATTQPTERASIHGEDTSHAGLTVSFPIMLAQEGEVFTADDMRRFARTVTLGFGRLGDGVLLADVTGDARSDPARLGSPASWLSLAQWDPQVKQTILPFCEHFQPTPRPLELSILIGIEK